MRHRVSGLRVRHTSNSEQPLRDTGSSPTYVKNPFSRQWVSTTMTILAVGRAFRKAIAAPGSSVTSYASSSGPLALAFSAPRTCSMYMIYTMS